MSVVQKGKVQGQKMKFYVDKYCQIWTLVGWEDIWAKFINQSEGWCKGL